MHDLVGMKARFRPIASAISTLRVTKDTDREQMLEIEPCSVVGKQPARQIV